MIEAGQVYEWREGTSFHVVQVLDLEEGMFEDQVRFKCIDAHNDHLIDQEDTMPIYIIQDEYELMKQDAFSKQKRKLNI